MLKTYEPLEILKKQVNLYVAAGSVKGIMKAWKLYNTMVFMDYHKDRYKNLAQRAYRLVDELDDIDTEIVFKEQLKDL